MNRADLSRERLLTFGHSTATQEQLAARGLLLHLSHDVRLTEHRPTVGARLRDDGLLVYDQQ
ncbi:hypothetical protein [Streptomyces sp. NPDC088254]|uniref:hypothetical protein n=1 Tax=Streptomyces sp. NPDC088254 TaxID=3365847 RepID=UPI0037FCE113